MAHSYSHGMVMEGDKLPNSNISVTIDSVEKSQAKDDKETYTNDDYMDDIIKHIEHNMEIYPKTSEQADKTEKTQRDKDRRIAILEMDL